MKSLTEKQVQSVLQTGLLSASTPAFNHLRTLAINQNIKLPSQNARDVIIGLTNMASLTHLEISNNNLGKLTSFDCFSNMKFIRRLNLHGNGISTKLAVEIFSKAKNSNLMELDLSKNDISILMFFAQRIFTAVYPYRLLMSENSNSSRPSKRTFVPSYVHYLDIRDCLIPWDKSFRRWNRDQAEFVVNCLRSDLQLVINSYIHTVIFGHYLHPRAITMEQEIEYQNTYPQHRIPAEKLSNVLHKPPNPLPKMPIWPSHDSLDSLATKLDLSVVDEYLIMQALKPHSWMWPKESELPKVYAQRLEEIKSIDKDYPGNDAEKTLLEYNKRGTDAIKTIASKVAETSKARMDQVNPELSMHDNEYIKEARTRSYQYFAHVAANWTGF